MSSKFKIAVFITLCLCCFSAEARKMADFFVNAPLSVAGAFSKNTRLDMIDYHRGGLDTPSQNALGGRSRITSLTDNSMSIQVSNNTFVDMAVMANKGDTTLVVIETVKTPIPDSSIRLYTKDWEPLPPVVMPGIDDFINPRHKKEAKKAEKPKFLFMLAEFDPLFNTFSFTDLTAKYYVKTEMPEIFKYTQAKITTRLDGNKFKRISKL